jgi:hypothetical protein
MKKQNIDLEWNFPSSHQFLEEVIFWCGIVSDWEKLDFETKSAIVEASQVLLGTSVELKRKVRIQSFAGKIANL